MIEYELKINDKVHIFRHEKTFTRKDLEEMIKQAISELKWNGIRQTYGNEINYMVHYFGFHLSS